MFWYKWYYEELSGLAKDGFVYLKCEICWALPLCCYNTANLGHCCLRMLALFVRLWYRFKIAASFTTYGAPKCDSASTTVVNVCDKYSFVELKYINALWALFSKDTRNIDNSTFDGCHVHCMSSVMFALSGIAFLFTLRYDVPSCLLWVMAWYGNVVPTSPSDCRNPAVLADYRNKWNSGK